MLVADGTSVVNWQTIDRKAKDEASKALKSMSVLLPEAITLENGRPGRPARVEISANTWEAASYSVKDDSVYLIRDPRTRGGPEVSQNSVKLLYSTTANDLIGTWSDGWDGSSIAISNQGGRTLAVLTTENKPHSWKSVEIEVHNGAFSFVFYTDILCTTRDQTAGSLTGMPEQGGKVLRFSNDFTWSRQQ